MRQVVGLEERKPEAHEEVSGKMSEGIMDPSQGPSDRFGFRLFGSPLSGLHGIGLELPDAHGGISPGFVMVHVTFFPAVQGRDGDGPVRTEVCDGTGAPGILIQDGEDEAEGVVGEGDEGIRKDSMAVIPGSRSARTVTFAAFPAQVDGDHDILIEAPAVFDVGDAAPVGGGFPKSPDLPAAALAGTPVGIESGEGILGDLEVIGTEAGLSGRYSYSLHWLILSMARERQRSGLLPWVPMEGWCLGRMEYTLVGWGSSSFRLYIVTSKPYPLRLYNKKSVVHHDTLNEGGCS